MFNTRVNVQSRYFDLGMLLLLAALVAFKWNDLHLPYFWDELGVYCQAAIKFYKEGPSLMPGSLDPEISRGHPLLFQFLSGWALRIGGNTPFTAHLFAFGISLWLLLAIYTKVTALFNRATAFATCLILAVQPAFLAICCLLLPEIMLTLWAWLGVTNYYQRNYVRAGLFVCLAILTKETAISLPVVLLGYSLLHYLFYRDHRGAFAPVALLATIAPFAVLALFLVAQKQQNGWYFFPYHVSTVTTNLHDIYLNFKRYFKFLLLQYHRYWLLLLVAAATFQLLLKSRINIAAGRNSFVLLALFMCAAVVAGSCFAFYMARYVMLVFPVLALLTALSIHYLFSQTWLRGLILTGLTVVALQAQSGNAFNYEDDLAYRKSLTTVTQAIRYTESITNYGDTIIGRFPVYFALMTTEYGYTTRYLPSQPTDSLYWKHVYYIDSDPGIWEPKPWPDSLFELVKDFRDGYASATVYRLKVSERSKLFLK